MCLCVFTGVFQLPAKPIEWRQDMFKTGTKIVMTKGYKGVKGVITERTDSPFEFYIIKLENGINIVVGPSAFINVEDLEDAQT